MISTGLNIDSHTYFFFKPVFKTVLYSRVVTRPIRYFIATTDPSLGWDKYLSILHVTITMEEKSTMKNDTTYYNVDLTIAVRDGMSKTEIENELESIMDLNSDEIRECVMVSKTDEVK